MDVYSLGQESTLQAKAVHPPVQYTLLDALSLDKVKIRQDNLILRLMLLHLSVEERDTAGGKNSL